MSSPARTLPKASTYPAPGQLSRTLSSSLRQHRRTPYIRQKDNIDGVRSYGTFSGSNRPSLPEEDESPVDNHHTGSDDEDDEIEAQESDQADSDGLYPPNCTWTSDGATPKAADPYGNSGCAVWHRIHEIRRDIIDTIDDPYSLEQLKAPRLNISIIRPLVDKFYALQDLSIVYCLLVNRTQFIREQSYAAPHQTVNLTRALVCEMLAEKVLRRYNENNHGPLGLLKLANILVAGFEPFQGAPERVIRNSAHAMHWAHQRKGNSYERKMTALEIAIVSESKNFLASSACQKVVDAIYKGKIVYSPSSFIDIIPDHWKRRPISLYDPRRAPILNQYRLIVPRIRNIIEIAHFIILLVLYILVMSGRETRRTTKYEIVEVVFDVYAGGWVLDQFASILEHGWGVYTQNLWSFLDVAFSLQFVFYFIFRMHALRVHDEAESIQWATTALDILSCGAPVLIPRLAFNVMSENLLFLSLRAMMSDFLTLTALAIWCFGGFLLSLKWLHNGLHHSITIGKWMIWIWFGLDGTGIDRAGEFHSILGPVLMITFAFLGNTLFLTILVAMLTNTFSIITSNAIQEIQYRRTVLTFMGVKSDAIFAYMPPFNLLALVILLPAKFFISPRYFHKINVQAVRILNAPTLLIIGLYERHSLWVPDRYKNNRVRTMSIDWKHENGPRTMSSLWWRQKFQFWDFSRFSVHGDIQAVFEETPDDQPPPQTPADTPPSPEQELRRDSLYYNHDTGFSTDENGPQSKSKRRKSKKLDKNTILRREFFDEDEEQEADDHPAGYTKVTRAARKDSIIDYETHHIGTQEANVRLQKLEDSVQRIEALLLQLIDNDGDDEDVTQQQLKHDIEIEQV